MNAASLRLSLALSLVAALGSGVPRAEDAWPEPRPIAAELPAFRAPAEPPDEDGPPASGAEEPTGPLTLDAALALALARNPLLVDSSYEVREGEARARQSGKMPNPELDVRLYRVEDSGQTVDSDDEGRARLILSELFELGGKRSRRVTLAERESQVAGWEYEARRIEVVTAVRSRFAEVLGAQRRVGSWRALVEFLDGLAVRVVDLVASGALRGVEAHTVARRLGESRGELAEAERDLAIARHHLAATWSGEAPRFTEAAGDLDAPSPLPPIDAVLEVARQSPAIARWDTEVARSEAQLALARAGRVPDVRAGVGVRWREDTSDPDYLVDFEIELPLADRKQGDTLEARQAAARARSGQEAAAAAHGALVAESYHAARAAAVRGESIERHVLTAARAIVDAHARALEAGAGDVEDLVEARRDLARTEADLAQSLVDHAVARAELEGLVGRRLGGE